jgi:NADPH:quinone reductase-like Zn-dependent oxidoreductase
VDVVFDVVGGDVLEKAWRLVRDDGVLVTVSDPPPAWAFDKTVVPPEVEGRPELKYVYFIVSPDGEALEKVAGLIDEGALQPLPVVEFPLEKAVEAWEFAKQRGRQGKVVINFVSDN